LFFHMRGAVRFSQRRRILSPLACGRYGSHRCQ
jgi:hypothetical protein